MKLRDLALAAALHLGFALSAFAAVAADYPTPKEGDFVAKDFRFSTGEVLPELKLHYTTIGEPTGEPILIPIAPSCEVAQCW